jgi:phosphoribosylanthranilate isomerase
MLSGGLDPGNVAQALRIAHAPAVDVSSGVERAPGEKDVEKIRAFIRAARGIPDSSPDRDKDAVDDTPRSRVPGSITDVTA